MKRFLSLFAVGIMAVLPMVVKAADDVELSYNCTDFDSNGIRTCTVSSKFGVATDSAVVTLTEHGGADVTEITASSDWTIVSRPEVNGVHTITLSYNEPSAAGEYTLFTFKYKESGTDDCEIVLGLGNNNVTIPTPNTPTENKQTGSTVPYIALGTMAILAAGAYMVTKNKTKMFNI